MVFSVVRYALFQRREHSNSLFQGRPEGETVSGETGFSSTVRFVSTFRERRQFVSSQGRPKKRNSFRADVKKEQLHLKRSELERSRNVGRMRNLLLKPEEPRVCRDKSD